MPSDEELRKVAEDIRALARSLARDVLDASRSARWESRAARDALRRGLREAADEARREFARGLWPDHHRRSWGAPPPRVRPAGPTPAPRSCRPAAPTRPAAGSTSLPPVRHRWDAGAIAAALAILFGVAWLLVALHAVAVPAEAVMAGGLILLGAAIVVTARTDWSLSRHTWPVAAGALLIVGLLATSSTYGVNGALSHFSVGDTTVSASGAGGTYYNGFGQLTLDATATRPGGTIHLEGLAGSTNVRLAPDQHAVVWARVLAGQICIQGHNYNGVGPTAGPVTIGSGASDPVSIYIQQLAGQVVVGTGCAGGQ